MKAEIILVVEKTTKQEEKEIWIRSKQHCPCCGVRSLWSRTYDSIPEAFRVHRVEYDDKEYLLLSYFCHDCGYEFFAVLPFPRSPRTLWNDKAIQRAARLKEFKEKEER